MPFVFSLEFDTKTELDIISKNSEHLARFPIGYDDETDLVYSGLVIFSPLPGGNTELVFAIVSSDALGIEITNYYDGKLTRPIITSSITRRLIVDAFFAAIECLIDEYRPEIISMVTYTADLPQKALEKFERISGLFRKRGYNAGRADKWHGRFIWMMKLGK